MRRPFFVAAAVLAGTALMSAADKPRIYIAETGGTEITAENLTVRKGTSSRQIEIMKEFLEECPGVTITDSREKADYTVRFISPNSFNPFRDASKAAVFNRQDDLIHVETARSRSRAVKNTCTALLKHATSTH